MNEGLHKFWWLWLPLLMGGIQIVLELALPSGILSELHTEQGPHELIQLLLISSAFLVAVRCLWQMDMRAHKWLAAWVALAAICCFYVAGEEISWGQHILQWSTPEYWAYINDQGETNLHNTSSWLDQKPRLVLLIGTIVGGLIIPFLQRFKPVWLPQAFMTIYPPAQLVVVALLAVTVKLVEKIDEALKDVVLMERASEVEELYLFYFVLLYLIVLRRRILQDQR